MFSASPFPGPGLHGLVMRRSTTARHSYQDSAVRQRHRRWPHPTPQRSPADGSREHFPRIFVSLAFWLRPWECGKSPACSWDGRAQHPHSTRSVPSSMLIVHKLSMPTVSRQRHVGSYPHNARGCSPSSARLAPFPLARW